jgi:uroporphyrinogen decarboxylase
MNKRTITDRENFLRTIEFRYPEWNPVLFDLGTSAWLKYGKELEKIVLKHPLVFPDYQAGSFPTVPTDPFFKVYNSLLDDWGCIWRNLQPGLLGQVVGHPLADWKAFETFQPPDPSQQYNWSKIRDQIGQDRQNGRLTRGLMSITQGGFFDRLQFLRGMENLMMDFATHPSQISSLIEMILEYNMKYIRLWLEIGVDQFYFHGDIGTQKSLLFSPAAFRQYLKPAYKEMFSTCRRAGSHVWYSSDGRMLEIVDELIECGVTLHDPQLGPNPLEDIARVYKGRLCAMVDIDEQVFPFFTPEQLHERVQEVVNTMATPEGGMMIYIGCNHDTPLENIEVLCSAAEEYCL